MKKDYVLIGKKISVNGIDYYQPDYSGEGDVYKNEQAFEENPDEVCYIPEHAFDDLEPVMIDGAEYYEANGYTRNDLAELIGDGIFGDEEEDKWTVEQFFYIKCQWAYPETYIEELSH